MSESLGRFSGVPLSSTFDYRRDSSARDYLVNLPNDSHRYASPKDNYSIRNNQSSSFLNQTMTSLNNRDFGDSKANVGLKDHQFLGQETGRASIINDRYPLNSTQENSLTKTFSYGRPLLENNLTESLAATSNNAQGNSTTVLDQYVAKPLVSQLDTPKKRVKSDVDEQETFNRKEYLTSSQFQILDHNYSPIFGNGTRSARSNHDTLE